MSDSQEQSWSDNPNAPKIPPLLYIWEKAYFAGALLGTILYGMVIVLFFKCMAALLNPARRKEGIKWGYVSYTAAMFSAVTVFVGMELNILSVSYIDNRRFAGVGGMLPPGPHGYELFIYSKALSIVPNLMFLLTNWLADGLLLYRCYVIYSKRLWVIALPCLLYLTSVAMGTMLIYQTSQPNDNIWNTLALNFGLPYFSISIALNILLTLMIIIRLVLYTRDICTSTGAPAGVGGLYKAIVTMLIESCALYAVSSLLFIGLWGAGKPVANIFLTILSQTQVIAPLFIIQRVANKRASTGNTAVSGHLSSFKARSRGRSTSGSFTLPGGDHIRSVDEHGMSSGAGVEAVIDSHRDKV